MMHDFAITKDHVIFADLPMYFDVKRPLLFEEQLFKLDHFSPARYGVMKKYEQDVQKIKWFNFPSHYCFHYINSWEEKNDNGDTIVKIFGCVSTPKECDRFDEFGDKFSQDVYSKIPEAKIVKIELNLENGNTVYKVCDYKYSVDLPTIARETVGYKSKIAYMPYKGDVPPDTKSAKESVFF